jgi:hypothetical protein
MLQYLIPGIPRFRKGKGPVLAEPRPVSHALPGETERLFAFIITWRHPVIIAPDKVPPFYPVDLQTELFRSKYMIIAINDNRHLHRITVKLQMMRRSSIA